jgi:hypothetical protein
MRHDADPRRFVQVKTHLGGGLMRYCMKRTGQGQPDSCAERAETRPLKSGLKQSARLFPSASPMLGAGQREIQNHKPQSHFLRSLQKGFLSLLLLRRRNLTDKMPVVGDRDGHQVDQQGIFP